MEVVSNEFELIQQKASFKGLSEDKIAEQINAVMEDYDITELEEVCLARSYDILAALSKSKLKDTISALLSSAAIGTLGVAGLPFNITLSTFLKYKVVQTIAMFYGYNAKDDYS